MNNYLAALAQEHISQEQNEEKGVCIYCDNTGTFGYDLKRVKNTNFGITGEDILHTYCVEKFKNELKQL
jgi:hypothetical protein